MKIGQAIDEIFKDNSKSYQGIDKEGFKFALEYEIGNNVIQIRGPFGARMSNVLSSRFSEMDWELVQKPVTFMEVGKSKNIRIEHDLLLDCDKLTFRDTRAMLSYLVKTFINSGVVEILTEGKFYIEEGN